MGDVVAAYRRSEEIYSALRPPQFGRSVFSAFGTRSPSFSDQPGTVLTVWVRRRRRGECGGCGGCGGMAVVGLWAAER